jgi:hypothetical protein
VFASYLLTLVPCVILHVVSVRIIICTIVFARNVIAGFCDIRLLKLFFVIIVILHNFSDGIGYNTNSWVPD